MTDLQKLELRQSEIRQRLAELNAVADLDDKERSEMDALSREYADTERRSRAAIIAAEAEAQSAANDFETRQDGASAEVRSLRSRVSIRDYLGAAHGGIAPIGAAAELNDALDVKTIESDGAVCVPWSVLETRTETRADASTTSAALAGPQMQRPILQRLFGSKNLLAALGVRFDDVPRGRTEWPLLTGGSAPAQTKEDAAHDAVAATFATTTLKPKRLTGRYRYTIEQSAQIGSGLEAALRRDLAAAVESSMCTSIVNGTAPDDTNPERVEGFLPKLTAPTAPTTAPSFATGAALAGASTVIDGLHASTEGEVRIVIGPASYRVLAGVIGSGSDMAITEALRTRSGGLQASPYIPEPANNVQHGIVHGAGPNAGGPMMRGDSVAAMWGGSVRMIRDPYSGAASGQVSLTWSTLWDASVAFRSAAYAQVSFFTG